jgi:hypothetical protein
MLTKYEQETIINFNEEEEIAFIYTTSVKVAKRFINAGYPFTKNENELFEFELSKRNLKLLNKNEKRKSFYLSGTYDKVQKSVGETMLLKYEKETVIIFNEEEECAIVSTTSSKTAKRMVKAGYKAIMRDIESYRFEVQKRSLKILIPNQKRKSFFPTGKS